MAKTHHSVVGLWKRLRPDFGSESDGAYAHLALGQRAWIAASFGGAITCVLGRIINPVANAVQRSMMPLFLTSEFFSGSIPADDFTAAWIRASWPAILLYCIV